jgi:hypothetical protein
MNATVCGDMTMVRDQRFMIFYSDWGGLSKGAEERGGDQ